MRNKDRTLYKEKNDLKSKIQKNRQKLKDKGITLIALVVTIIILLILTGVVINISLGENGLIAKAQLTAFIYEMQGIKEQVKLKEMNIVSNAYMYGEQIELFDTKLNANDIKILETLKKEILYGRAGKPEDKSPDDYNVEEFDGLIEENGDVKGIYIIDKETGNGKENIYVYDEETDTVYKVPATKIGGKVYHSYETARSGKGGESSEESGGEGGYIQDEPKEEKVGDIYYYGPNLKGFNAKNTYVVYYSTDFTKTKEVTAEEYMAGGQQRQITEGNETYTLHDYSTTSKIWANVRTEKPDGNGDKDLEAWWVWIPRYAYKIEDNKMNIEFVGTDDKPLDPAKENLEDGYEVHPAFKEDGDLKGIWMSKYEPSYKYLETSNKVLAPDMEGFDKDKTFIELYNGSDGFDEEPLSEVKDKLNTINNDGRWYDYEKQIWANIKTVSKDAEGNITGEAWWVWIPRYAYKISKTPSGNKMDIIYIDVNNKPLDTKYGKTLPRGFEVHPSFTGDNSKLKGIWMSKYEPSKKETQ